MSDRLLEEMSEQEREEFNFDVAQIDWRVQISNFMIGIRRYYLHEDVAYGDFDQIMAKENIAFFEDAKLALNATKDLVFKSNDTYLNGEVNAQKFQAYLESIKG